jgi:uncharacterized protein
VANVILDTGPLVALFKRNDQHHARAVQWFKRNRARLLTTLPVLTEAWHLVAPSARLKLSTFCARAVAVPDLGEDAPSRIHSTLERYADGRMDFADASLVLLAEHSDTLALATIDLGDFAAFRLASGKRFRLVFQS